MSAEPAQSPFDLLRARALILGLLGLSVLAAIPLAGAGRGGMLWVANLLYLVGLGYAVWLARRRGVVLGRLLGPRVPLGETLRVLAVVPALTAINWGAAWLVFYPLSLLSPDFVRSWLENMDRAFPPTEGFLDRGLLIVSLVVVAPVVEEFVFRGLLLHRWSRKWGMVRGVLSSTAAFAVLHFSPVGIFLLGLGLAAIYLRTGSLRLAIAAHGLNNLLALAVAPLLMPGWNSDNDPLAGFQRALPGGLAALAGGLVAAVLLREHYWPRAGTPLPYELGDADRGKEPAAATDDMTREREGV
jgi:membrane protease YdiL (CAAX protease family)